jgi:hypothetical protein
MGIRLRCPNGHKIHVKSFLAGRRGVCPHCGARFEIPTAAETSSDDAGTDEIAVVPSNEGAPVGQAALPASTSVAFVATESALPAAPASGTAGGEIWYVRHPLHGHFGPATWETVQRWAAEDRISADSLIWREGWADWRPAPTVLQQQSAAAETAPASPRARDPLDLDALAAAGGGGAFGAASQRMAARRKNAQTMRMVTFVLAAAVTLLTCVLLYVLMRSQ